MKNEEFQNQMRSIPDLNLAEMAHSALSKLCKTGGHSFQMTVPPNKNDTDMILSEVITRFEKSRGGGELIMPTAEDIKRWFQILVGRSETDMKIDMLTTFKFHRELQAKEKEAGE